MNDGMNAGGWQFWIDRGGTFTDVVAKRPDGTIETRKLLSQNPERYRDAAIQGIRDSLGLKPGERIPSEAIRAVKMGTTVATNALLERRGDRTVLAITRGFGDALRIGYQNRPKLFDRRIVLPELLYERVVEVDERIDAGGTVLTPLDEDGARAGLQAAYDDGIRSVAIVFMHGYRHVAHERRVAEIAREIGFTQVSTSHQTSPLMKLVSRGDTTVVDAYLSPILRRYVDGVAEELGDVRLMFMQSNGGLTDARLFQGKDSILSGPAGGVVGMVRTAEIAGFGQVIGFDMGGTSTDVSHYDGEYERAFETQVAGRADAGADDAHPHRRRRRRLDPPFRWRPVQGRSRVRRRRSRPGLLPPRRAAGGDRLQCHARPHPAPVLPQGVRTGRRPAARRRRGRAAVRRLGLRDRRRRRRAEDARAGGRGVPHDRRREHGQRDQADLGAARLRRHRIHAELLRRRRRPARLHGRRFPRHDHGAGPPLRRGAVGLRHGVGGYPGNARAIGRVDARARGARRPRRPARRPRVRCAGRDRGSGGRGRQYHRARQGPSPLPGHRYRADRPVRRSGRDDRGVRGPAHPAFRLHHAGAQADRRGDLGGGDRGDREDHRPGTRDAGGPEGAGGPGHRRERVRRRPAADAGLRPRRPRPRRRHRRPGDRRRRQRDDGGRARLARRDHGPRPLDPPPGGRAAEGRGGGHPRRSGDARSVQQPVHVDRRADGGDAGQHRLLGQHQGTAGLLLRGVRPRRPPDRQRAAHAGASRLHGREHRDGDPRAPGHDEAGRRLRPQRPLQRRHPSPRHHRDHPGVRRRRQRDPVLRRLARPPRRHRRHHPRFDAARQPHGRRGRGADRQPAAWSRVAGSARRR